MVNTRDQMDSLPQKLTLQQVSDKFHSRVEDYFERVTVARQTGKDSHELLQEYEGLVVEIENAVRNAKDIIAGESLMDKNTDLKQLYMFVFLDGQIYARSV